MICDAGCWQFASDEGAVGGAGGRGGGQEEGGGHQARPDVALVRRSVCMMVWYIKEKV